MSNLQLNLNKTTFKDKLNKFLKGDLFLFLYCLFVSFITLYLICTSFFSFVYFELSYSIFNIGKWDEFIRVIFAIIWLFSTFLFFTYKKDM